MKRFQLFNIVLAVVLVIFTVFIAKGYMGMWWLPLPLFIHLSIFFLGAVNIRWNFFLTSLFKGKNPKYISLTFDDGPAAFTNDILDILQQQNVKATFFTIGKHAAKYPAVVKRWHNEGHTIGNHSYTHGFNFDWQSSNKMAEEIEHTNRVIGELTGQVPNLFRPPYGITNPNLGRAVANTNMLSIGWTLRSFDTKAKDPEKLLADMLGKLQGGDIILLHDSMAITVKILTSLIVQAKQMGYTFVPVNELLEIAPYKKP
ncbi:MAG: polysaccharide deacetylase family protein [Sphingobacteriales bacterium]|nr:MAG: polysaccharide deacetylase family protein [Sphingobacteriales bacterium]